MSPPNIIHILLFLTLLPLSLQLFPPNSNTPTFNYTFDCSYLFPELPPCNLLNLTFSSAVFSKSPESALSDMNAFLEDSYTVKRKFYLQPEQNLSGYSMVLTEEVPANESIAVFFSQEDILHGRSFGRAYLKSFPEIDLHLEYPPLELPHNDLELTLALLYHLYRIEHSKFALDLRLLPRELRPPAVSFSEYEIRLLGDNTLARNSSLAFRNGVQKAYSDLQRKMEWKWSREEIVSFLNGRDRIPHQDFVYAFLMVATKAASFMHQGARQSYFTPVFMHLRWADDFHVNQTRIYRFMTGRDLFSSKIMSRFGEKADAMILNDMFEAKTEHFLMFHSFVPRRNDFDCIRIRVLPEYVAKDWMLNSDGEECFDRVLNASVSNYHIVALNMNMDEEERLKCEMMLKRMEGEDMERKQNIVMKKCPFSGYKVVDMWAKALQEVDEEQKAELKEHLKKAKEYVKMRRELGLESSNGELIRKFWESQISLLEDIKKKMKYYRELSLKRIKAEKEQEKMTRQQQPFSEDKIEL